MKTVKKMIFPLLLLLDCCAVYFWQHSVASLPYLPRNCIVPLGILTPTLIVLTFAATNAMLKSCGTSRPVLRSFIGAAAMLIPIAATGVFFLSYLTYRYAAALPVLVLPDWPVGIVTMLITAVCLIQITALPVCLFIKKKISIKRAIPAAVVWILLNGCLFLITT